VDKPQRGRGRRGGGGSDAPSTSHRAHGKRLRFVGRLGRLGILYSVVVPAEVSRAIGVRGRVPVVARVARRAPFRSTLVPAGGGKHRIFLNGETRRAAGVDVGDDVAVEVVVDFAPREVPIPDDLARALREEGVLADWESLPPGKREHILDWIEEAVHDATREKRIARAVEEAWAKREKRIDRVRS
jgi:bacteriocin resistance YdeI/OmpD-like protein/uncharacterized protein DUF1905